MPASSHASKELSTASLRVVKTAFAGDEKPTCCRFLAKYSAVLLEVILDTTISCCLSSGITTSEPTVACEGFTRFPESEFQQLLGFSCENYTVCRRPQYFSCCS